MVKKNGPVTTKKWNPSLPPLEPLTVSLWNDDPLTFSCLGDQTIEPEGIVGRTYVGYGFAILVSIDNTIHGRLLHVSVSAREELPPWELLIQLKRTLFPADVAAAMIMPEEQSYVNIAEVMHIWQLPVQWQVL